MDKDFEDKLFDLLAEEGICLATYCDGGLIHADADTGKWKITCFGKNVMFYVRLNAAIKKAKKE